MVSGKYDPLVRVEYDPMMVNGHNPMMVNEHNPMMSPALTAEQTIRSVIKESRSCFREDWYPYPKVFLPAATPPQNLWSLHNGRLSERGTHYLADSQCVLFDI